MAVIVVVDIEGGVDQEDGIWGGVMCVLWRAGMFLLCPLSPRHHGDETDGLF